MTSDRFRTQAEAFIAESLQADIPGISVDPGSGVNNVLVRGGGAVHAALHQEIEHVLTSRDISDPEALSTADLDQDLAPLLIERDSGKFSKGFVNLHFAERKARTVGQGTRAATGDRLKVYTTDSDLVFDESDYLAEPNDGTFYLRVPFSARVAGPEYDADVGEINVLIDNRLGALYARNQAVFLGGLPAQTNSQYLGTVTRGVSTRTPLNVDGAILTLQRLFGTRLLDAMIIGNGDPEMTRDELYDQGAGVLALGPTGSATGVHIGGRTDAYHWYPQVNYVEVDVDLTVDLVTTALTALGSSTLQAQFAAGATSANAVPEAGVLVLELGGAGEETVRYASRTYTPSTGMYLFTLSTATTVAHALGSAVKVAGTGEIDVSVTGGISILPVLRVASVRLLDPLTGSPIGSALSEVTADEKAAGWYFSDINPLTFMSAKEQRTLHVDEKRDVAGNAALSGSDGVTSATRLLASATTDFTGYQGRDITITQGATTVTRAVTRVISATQIEYADGDDVLADDTGLSFSAAVNFGDFLQYPVRIGYYTHTEIQEAQDVFDKGRVRVMCSDILSRAFLPMFLDFSLGFRGPGTAAQVRSAILRLIQQSQGSNLGASQGAKFDLSDIVAAAYDQGLATGVDTPFEVKITSRSADGAVRVRWIAPSRNTVSDLVVAGAVSIGDTEVVATRPVQVAEFTVPARGRLFLGAYVGDQESLDYDRVVFDGSQMTFVLTEGQQAQYAHGVNEPFRVSVADFDPDNVIVDGVIDEDRQFRPYFGTVVVTKLD